LLYYEGILEEVTQRKLEEEALKLQVKELRIEIDQNKRARQVAEITQSDYFLELQAEIENLQLNVDDEPVSEAVSELVSEPAPEPVRTVPMVLLVEDNEDNRDMLSRRLQRSGYEVAIAVDGAEGVSKTASEKPDIVLMDMSLPVIDGWEATQQLKANPQTRSIPVIALTAHAMSGDREKALSAGCDEYDTKPINLSRLLGKIETLLEKAKSS
jgi:CheY-like chemotaxis protein